MDFLVIDDDKTFRDATCYLIENEGHFAQPASSSEAALVNLKENDFDAVLLDVNLGPESGLDLLPQILRAHPNLPVIVFTAQGTVNTAVEAMRRGALDFLEKPFTREQFHRVVARPRHFHQRPDFQGFQSQPFHPEFLQQRAGFANPGHARPRTLTQVVARLAREFQIAANLLQIGVRLHLRQQRLTDRPGKKAVQKLQNRGEFQCLARKGINRSVGQP